MLVTKVTVVTNVNQEMVVCMGHVMSPTSATALLGGLARSVLLVSKFILRTSYFLNSLSFCEASADESLRNPFIVGKPVGPHSLQHELKSFLLRAKKICYIDSLNS